MVPWASQYLGLTDTWTAIQFDAAVSYFGRWVDNRLSEFEKDGSAKYRLEDLLADESKPVSLVEFFSAFGIKPTTGTAK